MDRLKSAFSQVGLHCHLDAVRGARVQQVNRVAAARHVSPAAIRALVTQYTQGRTLGFLGEPRVDVLTLNIALDQKYPLQG